MYFVVARPLRSVSVSYSAIDPRAYESPFAWNATSLVSVYTLLISF